MALVPVTFVVVDSTLPVPNALEETTVRVYSEDGETFYTQGLTDEDGVLVLDLEDATRFWVRFIKTEYAFQSKMFIDVDSGAANNTFDIEGTNLTEYPPAGVPELCRASGVMVGANGAPVEGVFVQFVATELPDVIGGRARVQSSVRAFTEQWGYVEVELVRGGVYDCTVMGHEDKTIEVFVPDRGATNISDLIFPYVARVDWDPESLTLSVNETAKTQCTLTLSSGTQTPIPRDNDTFIRAGYFVEFVITDSSVVEITRVTDTDEFEIMGKKAGTTTITATLRKKVTAKRLPAPVSVLNVLTVTVT